VPSSPGAIELGVNDKTGVGLSWRAPADAGSSPVIGYHLEYRRSTETTWVLVNSSPIVGTSYTFIGPSPRMGVMFNIRVRAINSNGLGQPSGVLRVATPFVPSVPLSPVVTSVSSGNVRFEWQPPASIGSFPLSDYVIQVKTSSSTTWTTVDDGVSTATSNLVTGLTPGQTYNFRVRAVNQAGMGAFPRSLSRTVPMTTP
jgi:predicted phage tail protein